MSEACLTPQLDQSGLVQFFEVMGKRGGGDGQVTPHVTARDLIRRSNAPKNLISAGVSQRLGDLANLLGVHGLLDYATMKRDSADAALAISQLIMYIPTHAERCVSG